MQVMGAVSGGVWLGTYRVVRPGSVPCSKFRGGPAAGFLAQGVSG